MGNEQSSASEKRRSKMASRRATMSHLPATMTTAAAYPPAGHDAAPFHASASASPPPYTELGVNTPHAQSDVRRSTTYQAPSHSPPSVPRSSRRTASTSGYPAHPAAPAGGIGGFRRPASGVPQASPIRAQPAHIPTPPQTPRDPVGPQVPTGSAGTHARSGSIREDPREMLRKYDTVIVVDDSSSMAGALWREARAALASLADIAGQYDDDGIDVHFLNSPLQGSGLRTAAEVERLFDAIGSPDGITPTGEKLEILLLDYLLRLEAARDRADAGDMRAMQEIKPINYIVLTDGAPTDEPESVIITAARRLDARNFPISQVGIQFVQIGNDPSATQALQELDDELAGRHGIRDMVDTTPYTGQEITGDVLTKILLGGINRRVDRRGYTS